MIFTIDKCSLVKSLAVSFVYFCVGLFVSLCILAAGLLPDM
jgi:hypothetical protein